MGTETQQPQGSLCSWGRGSSLSPGEGDLWASGKAPEFRGGCSLPTSGCEHADQEPTCLFLCGSPTPSSVPHVKCHKVFQRRAGLTAPPDGAIHPHRRGSTQRSSWSLSVPLLTGQACLLGAGQGS